MSAGWSPGFRYLEASRWLAALFIHKGAQDQGRPQSKVRALPYAVSSLCHVFPVPCLPYAMQLKLGEMTKDNQEDTEGAVGGPL